MGASFKKLQAEWYAKLKANGFVDIEQDRRYLRSYSCSAYRQASLLERDSKLSYYTAMEHLIELHEFTCDKQRYIIQRVSEGAFVSEIVRELKGRQMPLDKHTVIHIIRRFEHETGLREWTAKQRNQKR